MLKDADSNAKPTKYAQNKRHGMYEGTPSMMNLAPERCSAPKTARGIAKHKLLKVTILSRPRACVMSVFAAHSATRKSSMPVPHIETTVREISKNAARMVVCMWMPSVCAGTLSGQIFPVNTASNLRMSGTRNRVDKQCPKQDPQSRCENCGNPEQQHSQRAVSKTTRSK